MRSDAGEELARVMREIRLENGLGLREAAHRCIMSPSTLSRFENARRLPSESMLRWWVKGMKQFRLMPENEVERILELWRQARGLQADEHLPLVGHRVENAPIRKNENGAHSYVQETREAPWFDMEEPDPTPASTAAALVEALNEVHVWAGDKSLRDIERQRPGVLNKSTVSDMLRHHRVPNFERYVAFLEVCRVKNIELWVAVWRRVKMTERRQRLGT